MSDVGAEHQRITLNARRQQQEGCCCYLVWKTSFISLKMAKPLRITSKLVYRPWEYSKLSCDELHSRLLFITFYWSLFNLIIHNFIVHHSGAWWIGIHDCELMNLMNLRNWWIWWNWGVINHKTYMWVCAAIHDSTWHGFLTLQSDIWLRCITRDDSGFNMPGS